MKKNMGVKTEDRTTQCKRRSRQTSKYYLPRHPNSSLPPRNTLQLPRPNVLNETLLRGQAENQPPTVTQKVLP